MTDSQRYALWLLLYEIRGGADADHWATYVSGIVSSMLELDQMEPERYTNGTVFIEVSDVQ